MTRDWLRTEYPDGMDERFCPLYCRDDCGGHYPMGKGTRVIFTAWYLYTGTVLPFLLQFETKYGNPFNSKLD
jgi:hypothetical protein